MAPRILSPSPWFAAFLAVLSSACARVNSDQIVPGKTSLREVKEKYGPPVRILTPASRPGEQIHKYPDQVEIQAEGQEIRVVSREPKEEERALQYWRHLWKGLEQRYVEVPGSGTLHGQREFQLIAPSRGMSVIYDPATDRITRVVRYGSH